MPQWYAFRIPPQKEFAAVDILAKRGFQAVVPYELKFYRRHRQKAMTARRYPLMNGYVLIPFDGPPPWHQLFAMNLIKSVVGVNGVPYEIPKAAIDHLFAISKQNVPTRNLNKGFKPGDKALLRNGPFTDWTVKVEAVHGDKARVLLGLFGAERNITVPLGHLEAA